MSPLCLSAQWLQRGQGLLCRRYSNPGSTFQTDTFNTVIPQTLHIYRLHSLGRNQIHTDTEHHHYFTVEPSQSLRWFSGVCLEVRLIPHTLSPPTPTPSQTPTPDHNYTPKNRSTRMSSWTQHPERQQCTHSTRWSPINHRPWAAERAHKAGSRIEGGGS